VANVIVFRASWVFAPVFVDAAFVGRGDRLRNAFSTVVTAALNVSTAVPFVTRLIGILVSVRRYSFVDVNIVSL
jgi:hypothetical protein